MNILMLPGRLIALADTHVNLDPTAEAGSPRITLMAARAAAAARTFRRRAALISHSNFGTQRRRQRREDARGRSR